MDNKNTDINYADFQAREKSIAIGKRYLNLFHQLHVIKAGLEALNKDFISLPDNVLEILPELSGGAKFFQHIKNLKDGSTPMNKIDADLLPFGKDVFENEDLFHKYTDYVHKSNVESAPSTSSSSSVIVVVLVLPPAVTVIELTSSILAPEGTLWLITYPLPPLTFKLIPFLEQYDLT